MKGRRQWKIYIELKRYSERNGNRDGENPERSCSETGR